jgi:hypothetical protein
MGATEDPVLGLGVKDKIESKRYIGPALLLQR